MILRSLLSISLLLLLLLVTVYNVKPISGYTLKTGNQKIYTDEEKDAENSIDRNKLKKCLSLEKERDVCYANLCRV